MQSSPPLCPRCQSLIPADAPGGICPGCALLAAANPSEVLPSALGGAPTLEEIAAAFPELEVLELIGHGGMGVVFKARQPRLDRCVALKILPLNLAVQPGFSERFSREARALARLNHPNIVAVYDFGESGGFFYLLMEFVDGVNLRQAIRAGVTPEQALALVPRLCEALQFAHDKGVLHRDIKPENILLDTAGTVKLVDFGIAKFAGDPAAGPGLTASGSVLGTASYMAPEQIEKPGSVDHRADIYSLGVVFYEMLTGELPIGRFAAPSERSTVNTGVDAVVFRALEKERDRRQQSATEMRTQVEGLGSGIAAQKPSAIVSDPVNPVRWHAASRLAHTGLWLTLAAAALLLLAVPGIWEAVRDSQSPGDFLHRQGRVIVWLVVPAALAVLGGVVATLTALIGYRFRAPWFFWFVTLLALVFMLVFSAVSVPGLLALGVLGYCLYDHREFFAERPAVPRATGANPWPHRLFWLVAGLLVLPLVGLFTWLLVPRLAMIGNDLGMRPSGWIVTLVRLLPAFAGAALFFAYHRTRPRAEMTAPEIAWNPWPKRIFFLLLALVVLPVVLFGLGLALPRFAQHSAQIPSHSPEMTSVAIVNSATPPFLAKFPRGSIELVAITEHPSVGGLGWQMDGAPAVEGPFVNDGSRAFPNDSQFAREFVFRTRDLPSDASHPSFKIEGIVGQSGGGAPESPHAPGKSLADHHLVAATFPRHKTTTDIRAGIAAGPWRTLVETAGTGSLSTSISERDTQWKITFGTALESKDGRTVISSTYAPQPNWEVRVVAVTKAGDEVCTSRSSANGQQSEWTFAELPLTTVREFQFQVRRMDRVEFRDVALAPRE